MDSFGISQSKLQCQDIPITSCWSFVANVFQWHWIRHPFNNQEQELHMGGQNCPFDIVEIA